MFDIYSLAKPRVFKIQNGGGSGSDTPSEKPTPDSVEWEFSVLNEFTGIVSEEEAEEDGHPEGAGRVGVDIGTGPAKSINIINAASDFGGRARRIENVPYSMLSSDGKVFRTEFRPKQGLHNLDFTTPAETPSEDTPSDDAQ